MGNNFSDPIPIENKLENEKIIFHNKPYQSIKSRR